MKEYDPRTLPQVTSVVIVDLRSIDANRVSEYMWGSKDAPKTKCDSETTERIAEIWRNLPPGEMGRCHTPPIGIRFYIGSQVVCDGSICWACENIFGTDDNDEYCYAFDSKSQSAVKLFDVIQAVVGPDVLSNREMD